MEIHTIGGYEKVGKNMTAIEADGKIIIFDMGADMEKVIEHEENLEDMRTVEAIGSKVVPDDSEIKNNHREDVAAIVVGHGHQDHSLAISKLAGAYDCPIIGTPYTCDLIERFIRNDEENVNNEIVRMNPGETYQFSEELELEFVHITHSIPQSVISFLRTSDGNLVYSLDFKLDKEPTLGPTVDYDRLKELGEEGVRAYIVDCTRADEPGRTRSEARTREELEKILTKAYEDKRGVIVTTFSSHIARLNNIIEANKGRREIVMIGRSLREYTKDAEGRGLINLSGIRVVSYREEVENTLKEVSRNKENYLLVVTGNQGEPNAVLSRIARDEYPYSIGDGDVVVFSSVAIPTPTNELNRKYIERMISQKGAKVETDIHSHGHARKEGHRDMMQMLKPETVIPAHGGKEKKSACASLAREEGIESIQVSSNRGKLVLD
ncbi:MAG: ribonuclease J [Hadesarchaea archaeon]|nr:ribonuclease J [Hadesarchaea archaeon]